MSRRLVTALAATVALGALACRIQDSTTPRAASTATRLDRGFDAEHDAGHGAEHEWSNIPGSKRPASSMQSNGALVACSQREAIADSALIGPSGGTLVVGNNRLIVPAGALTQPVMISGTVPAEPYAAIHFEPQGLQFRKPAGLQLDATGCTLPDGEQHVDYVADDGTVLERIDATYSNWWHAVAAPINHFSVYAIGL